jgi:hypothetical protein
MDSLIPNKNQPMKRFAFAFSFLLAIASTWTNSGYAVDPRAWPPPTWGPRGNYPAYGAYYGYPTYSYPGYANPRCAPPASGYPTYGYPTYGPPTYRYAYAPPANPYAQAAYLAQLAAYYARAAQQFYPTATPRAFTANPLPAAPDQTKLAEQDKRLKQLSTELTRVRQERDQAQAELATWTSLGVSIEQIRSFQGELARLQAANSSLVRQNNELDHQLSWYLGPDREVKMPADLAGTILTVDPKFQFVVLNIGSKQGVAKDGKLLVDRHGKLVGKLRITQVEPNSSVANIIPDWKVTEVMEGDQVIHQ